MEGHFVSRKQWYLAIVLLLSGSFASFALGQRLGHLRQQPVSHFVSHQAQAADVDGTLGSRTATAAPSVPAHHTNTKPPKTSAPPASSAPVPLSSKPQQHASAPLARGSDHEHGHHGHKHGHKDDGHPKAADRKGSGQKWHYESFPQPSNSAHPAASGKQKHGGH